MIYSVFVTLVFVTATYGQLGFPELSFENVFGTPPSSSTPPSSLFNFGNNFPSFGNFPSFQSPPADSSFGFSSDFPNSFSDFGFGSNFGFGSDSSVLPSLNTFVPALQNSVGFQDVIEAEVSTSFPDLDCDTGNSAEFQRTFKAALNAEVGCSADEDCVEIEDVACGSVTIKIRIRIIVGRVRIAIDVNASSEELSAAVSVLVKAGAEATGNVVVVVVSQVAVTQEPAPSTPTTPPASPYGNSKGFIEEDTSASIGMDTLTSILNL